MSDSPRVLVFQRSEGDPRIVAVLAQAAVEVVEAVTEEEALQAATEVAAAVVDLGDASEQGFLRRLLERVPELPVVVIADDDGSSSVVITAGAQDLLPRIDLEPARLERALRLAVERVRTVLALRKSEERYVLAVEGANDGLWDWHLQADRIHFSDRWMKMLGFEPNELDATSDAWFGRIHEDDVEEVKRRLAGHVEGQHESFQVEYRILHRDGHHRWMLARGLAVRDLEGRAYRIAGSQTDISKRKAAEMALQHQAWHDQITGLPNRALLLDRLSRALLRQRQHMMPFALLALGLDNYATITDSYGHEMCDAWTRAVAHQLEGLRGATDTLSRVGREQFALLVDNPKDLAQVLRLADAIQETLQTPLMVDDEELFTTVSIGIVAGDGQHTAAEDYLRDASVAMNRAKSLGGAQHRVFDTPMHRHVVERLQLEKELRKAIDQRQFVLRYQPIVSLRSGQVTGFEALLRWQHPRRGLLAPDAFIDQAESAGLLTPIFDVIFPTILDQLSQWHQHHRRSTPLFVNVNLSRGQFLDPKLIERVDQMMREHPVALGSVSFELTESMMVDHESVRRTLGALKERGIRLLLDDFGTGYSSLANLTNFPIDGIKIDRTFLRDLGTVDDSTEIIRAIVSLAHAMSMDVTVEGIETEDQLRFASNLGCEYGQGYFFATPLDPDSAAETIAGGYRTTPPPTSDTMARIERARGRIYIVEEARVIRNRLRLQLEEQGYEVWTASSGAECLDNAGADRPDVILMEIELSGMDGIETCRRLKQSPQTGPIPVLFLSEGQSEAVIVEALHAGGNDFVRKDTPLPILCARLDSQVAIGRTQQRLKNISMVDELTGVFTRRFLLQALRRSVKASTRRPPSGVALLFIDPDRLKQVNATQGVIEGDRVLRHVARTIDQLTRETDLLARYGGEEFVLVLGDSDLKGARLVAEKIRSCVESRCETTVSIGGAYLSQADIDQLRRDDQIDKLIAELLRGAETAMGQAKRAGRNRVAFEPGLSEDATA